MTELQQRYEAETGQSAIECIDVSKMGRRIITRATEEFLQWVDKFAQKRIDCSRYRENSRNAQEVKSYK